MADNNDNVTIEVDLAFIDKADTAQKMAKSISKSISPLQEKFNLVSHQLSKTPEKFIGNLTYIKTALKSLQPAITDAREDLIGFYESFGKMSSAFTDAQTKIAEYTEKIEKLESQERRLRDKKNQPAGLVGTDEEIEQAKQRVTDLTTKIDQLTNKYTENRKTIELNRRVVQYSTSEIAKERAELEYLSKALRTARSPRVIYKYEQRQKQLNNSIQQESERIRVLNKENQKLNGSSTLARNALIKYSIELQNAEAEHSRLTQVMSHSDEEIAKFEHQADEAANEVRRLKEELASISSNPIDFVKDAFTEQIANGPEEFNAFWEAFTDGADACQLSTDEINARLDELLKRMELLAEETEQPKSQFERLFAIIKSGLSSMGRVVSKTLPNVLNKITKLAHKLKSLFSKLTKGNKGLNIDTKRLMKSFLQFGLGVRSVYFLVRRMRTEFLNGMKELAKEFPEINEQVSSLSKNFNKLKGTMVTFIQPIASYVIPILSKLMNILSSVMEKFAQFFAVLTGQEVIYKAVAADVDYAESLDNVADSAKAANKELAEYDNLLVISKDTDSGSGSSTASDVGYTFEQASVSDAISEFAQRLKNAWNSADFEGVGELIAEKFNSIVATIDSWINNVFRPRGEEWAVRIALIINGLFNGWDADKTGKTIADFFNSLISIINNFINTTDWGQISEKFTQAFVSGLQSLNIDLLAETIQNIADGIVDMIGPIIDALPTVIRTVYNALFKLVPTIIDGLLSIIDAIAIHLPDFVQAIVAYLPEFLGMLTSSVLDLTGIILDSCGIIIDSVLKVFTIDTDATAFTAKISGTLSDLAEAIRFYTHNINIDLAELETGFSRTFKIASQDWLASEAQQTYGKNLLSRLDEIVDAQGRILEGYENEAAWISGELSAITGVELSIIDNRIKGWTELRDSIIDTFEVQQKEAQLAAEKTLYDGAIANLDKYQKAYDDAATKLHDYQVAEQFFTQLHLDKMAALLHKKVEDAQETYDQAEADLKNSNAIISQYLADEEAFTAGAYSAMNDSYLEFLQNTGTNSEELIGITTDTAQRYQEQMELWYDKYQEAINSNDEDTARYCESMIERYAGLLDATDDIYNELKGTVESYSETSANELDKVSENVSKNAEIITKHNEELMDDYATLSREVSKHDQELLDDFTNVSTNMSKHVTDAGNTMTRGGGLAVSALRDSVSATKHLQEQFNKSSLAIKSDANANFGSVEKSSNTLKSSLIQTFDAITNSVSKSWSSLWNNMKNTLNAILWGVESMANGVVRGINTLVSALNKIQFTIPSWVPALGGKSFGFNLGYVGGISLPRLAQGAVIPPNKEFLAVLGDQKYGTNIEAPLDTIKQAVAEVLAQNGGITMPNKIQIVMPNGRVLAETVWDEEKKYYKQTGAYRPGIA